jgi:hypothetical protein
MDDRRAKYWKTLTILVEQFGKKLVDLFDGPAAVARERSGGGKRAAVAIVELKSLGKLHDSPPECSLILVYCTHIYTCVKLPRFLAFNKA